MEVKELSRALAQRCKEVELSTPLVSIVCVTYNRRDLVVQCLDSCVKQNYPALEIIVVVNFSGDGTEEVIKEKFPQVRVIQTHRNVGAFPAYNLAIANSRGDYIMTVDDDAYFWDSEAITNLVAAFQKEQELGAVTCNIEGPAEMPLNEWDRYIHVVKTGFTMIPRKVFTEWVGYYPDLFFRDAGETYICTALWELGKPVKCLHQVRMYHYQAIQGRSDKDCKYDGLRSQILCSLMREPWYLLVPSLFSKLCKSLFSFIRWNHFFTWIQVWLSALLHVPGALSQRRPISWSTQKLLWQLRKEFVSDLSTIPQYEH